MKKTVVVEIEVVVEIDESKFDEEFMSEFRESFYQFQTVDDHIEHLAQLEARGLIDVFSDAFIEGYGPAKDMGIKTKIVGWTKEIIRD